jgi:Major Facilitator Superfamily
MDCQDSSRSVECLNVSWPLRRNRDFAIFFFTQGISNVGDAASGLLIPLFVLQLTHDPLQVSAVAALEIATFIGLRIPFGTLSDRRERRRLMIAADLARTALTLAIPVTSALHGPALPVVYAVIVPISAASALFDSGAGAAVPLLVPEESRGAAYGLTESAESIAWVVGPPLGGLLALLIGTGEAIGLDAASFLVSVAGLLAIRTRFEPDASEIRPERLWESTKAGLRLIGSDAVLRRDQLIWGLYSVFGGSIVLGLVYVGSHGGSKDTVLGSLALAAYAAGSAGGTLAAGALKPATPWLAMSGGLLAAAVGAALVATQAGAAVLIGAALFGSGEGLVLVFHLTLRANATPDSYLGRVTGVSTVIGQVAGLLSVGWLGLALRFGHGRIAFAILGAALFVLAAWVALAPKPGVGLAAEESAGATDSAPPPGEAAAPA